jgi:hypothetical protein
MKIKYSPVRWNEHSQIRAKENTEIFKKDENTILIDGEEFSFDIDSVQFSDIADNTNERILDAYRKDGELYLTIRRFYTESCVEWDTGEYNDY